MAKKGKKISPSPAPTSNTNKVEFLLIRWLFRLLLAGAMIVGGHVAGVIVRRLLISRHAKDEKAGHRKLIIHQIGEALYVILIGAGVFFALVSLGIQSTSLITIMGTLLVTAGLALQNILSSLASGIAIAITEPFYVGDRIQVRIYNSINKFKGVVRDFNIMNTSIDDEETGKIAYLPNNIIYNNYLINLERS